MSSAARAAPSRRFMAAMALQGGRRALRQASRETQLAVRLGCPRRGRDRARRGTAAALPRSVEAVLGAQAIGGLEVGGQHLGVEAGPRRPGAARSSVTWTFTRPRARAPQRSSSSPSRKPARGAGGPGSRRSGCSRSAGRRGPRSRVPARARCRSPSCSGSALPPRFTLSISGAAPPGLGPGAAGEGRHSGLRRRAHDARGEHLPGMAALVAKVESGKMLSRPS